MSDISFNLSGRIDPLLVKVLGSVNRTATELNIPFFVVGAMARDLVLEFCYNLPSRRSTQDLDIGVEVAGWEEYQKLTDALVSTGEFEPAREPQMLMHGDFRVDIVPFGQISPDQKNISWPPDHAIIMSVLGFKEAFDYSQSIQIHDDPDLVLRVPTIPGMALMKIIAWHDRYPERPKDAEDLLFLMEHYSEAGNEDRLFGQEVHFMELEGFDPAMAGIRLLGHDMALMVTPATRKLVFEILSNALDKPQDHRLIRDMAGPAYTTREQFGEIRAKIERLRQGFSFKTI